MINIARRLDAHVEHIVSNVDLKNGVFVKLLNLKPGEHEIFEVTIATSEDAEKERLLLHISPEYQYDERQTLQEFEGIKAGDVGRALHVSVGDVFEIPVSLIEEGVNIKVKDIEKGMFLHCGAQGGFAPISDESIQAAKDITNSNQKLIFKVTGRGTRWVGYKTGTVTPMNEEYIQIQAWT